MPNIKYTKEQEDIFEYTNKGVLNVLVEAVAGAGKTTTLIECVKRILEFKGNDKRILLLAHNISTRDALKKKLKEKLGDNCPNVKVFTLHGLGWRLFREKYDIIPNIDENKYQNYISKNINEISSELYFSLNRNNKMVYRGNLIELINLSRQYLKSGEKEIKKLAKKLNINVIADECHMVSNILKWGRTNLDTVDYQDLLYFPSILNYTKSKGYIADYIFLDEAQDASLAQQFIITCCMARQTRLIAFGDTDQTINSWCGSDINALENIEKNNNELIVNFNRQAMRFPLSINYRCGKKIIEYAKQFSNKSEEEGIKPCETAKDGIVRYDVRLSEIKDNDMVLCRNTAPLMQIYRKMISDGKNVYFRGEELGKNLINTVKEMNGNTIEEIIENVKRRMIAWWEFLTIETGLDPRETMTNPIIISNYDTLKTLEELPNSIKTREDLNMFLKEVFKNEGKDGIQLSTIHKAKGLEADNVFIICPSLIPSKLSQTENELAEERRLQYVMCTRPKNSLNFVSEKDIRPNSAYSENNSFYIELNKIKNEINR